MLVALVAAVFHERIFAEFGAGDTRGAEERCVTSRELLAVGRRSPPRRSPRSLVALAPRRARDRRRAPSSRSPTAALALALAVVALADPGEPVVGDWLVVDAAGGLLVGVIGLVGLASVLVSPAYLGTAQTALVSGPSARLRTYFAAALSFWAILLAVPLVGQPRRGLAARRGDDRRVRAARRLQRHARGARGGLEVPRS